MSQGEGGVGQLSKFGLSEGIAGSLATIIGTIGISVADTGACQYNKGKEILSNIAKNKELYKYLPAIVYPNRVRKAYLETYSDVASPIYGDLSTPKKIQSIMIRHGLLVSTQRNGKTVYFYIGGIPEGFNMISRLIVSQGGAIFGVKSYRSIFGGLNINPRFGILPVVTDGQYYTNPSISQGGNGIEADIVGIFNYMASTLYATFVGTSALPAFIVTSIGNYNANASLYNKLKSSTSESDFADTPAIHITLTNNLIAPSMPDSTNFNPTLLAYWYFNNEPFNRAIEGAPIYVTYTGSGSCIDLQLRGFVSYLNPVVDTFVINIPFTNKDIVLSPGLAFGGVIQPPQSWNYDDLVNWAIANGMGLSRNIFDKWVELTLFESDIIGQLIARGFEDLPDLVQEHFDPSFETVEKGVDYVVNGITNAYSAGKNAVINFLKSL
jgi:hypothetical protein